MMVISARNLGGNSYHWLWHRNETNAGYTFFNSGEQQSWSGWLNKPPTATDFSVPNNTHTNKAGGQFTAYLWAHDEPSEFSHDGNSPIIKAGKYTSNASPTPSVNLGFRPQWVWIYQNTHTGPRWVIDSTIGTNRTTPITTGTENTHGPNEITFTSTGFDIGNDANGNRSYLNQPGTYLYLAVAAP